MSVRAAELHPSCNYLLKIVIHVFCACHARNAAQSALHQEPTMGNNFKERADHLNSSYNFKMHLKREGAIDDVIIISLLG